MNENEFELDGVRYVAKEDAGCNGCELLGTLGCGKVMCAGSDREDRKNVIFIRVDKQSTTSDGSTADYYELPKGATQLQHLISFRNMNGQDAEMFRALYRKGHCSHSNLLREAKKVLFYAQAEVERLEKYGDQG